MKNEEIDDAMVWLLDNDIPSIGPVAATALVNIRDAIYEKKNVPPLVRRYANALNSVCAVLALHQGAVIETLGMLIQKAEDEASQE